MGAIPERTLPRLAVEVGGPGGTGVIAPWSQRRLERVYVLHHDPEASADSLLAQLVYTSAHVPAAQSTFGHDTTPTLLYALTDAEGSVVGLTDEIGRLVWKYD